MTKIWVGLTRLMRKRHRQRWRKAFFLRPLNKSKANSNQPYILVVSPTKTFNSMSINLDNSNLEAHLTLDKLISHLLDFSRSLSQGKIPNHFASIIPLFAIVILSYTKTIDIRVPRTFKSFSRPNICLLSAQSIWNVTTHSPLRNLPLV